MVSPIEPSQQNAPIPLSKRVWHGASLGLGLATVFFLFFGIASREWIFMPLITVTISGAIGGVFYFVFDQLGPAKGWPKVLFRILGILLYLAILWLSLVLAYSITGHWD